MHCILSGRDKLRLHGPKTKAISISENACRWRKGTVFLNKCEAPGRCWNMQPAWHKCRASCLSFTLRRCYFMTAFEVCDFFLYLICFYYILYNHAIHIL